MIEKALLYHAKGRNYFGIKPSNKDGQGKNGEVEGGQTRFEIAVLKRTSNVSSCAERSML